MPRSSSLVATLLALVTLHVGCTPRCQETCRKVLDCGLDSTRVAQQECVNSCQNQQALYIGWEDEAKEDALVEHKRCIREATCDELAAGACYDEDLFIFK